MVASMSLTRVWAWQNEEGTFDTVILADVDGQLHFSCGDPNTYRGGGVSCPLADFTENRKFWDLVEREAGQEAIDRVLEAARNLREPKP